MSLISEGNRTSDRDLETGLLSTVSSYASLALWFYRRLNAEPDSDSAARETEQPAEAEVGRGGDDDGLPRPDQSTAVGAPAIP